MNKNIIRILCASIALTLILNGIFTVSAKTYVTNIISGNFESADECKFLIPGDINADGYVNALDMTELKKMIMNGTGNASYQSFYSSFGKSAKYSDVNGDGLVDIRDLVRQKKNTVLNVNFIEDGTMQLNGNSAFNGDFISQLGTGASYKITYSYKSNQPVKIKLNGMGDTVTFEDAVAQEYTTVTHTFKTPLSFGNYDGIELQIIGVAKIKNFSVLRTDMDNELSVSRFK